MKICLFEDSQYDALYPLTYLRPALELRCGHTSLAEKLLRHYPGADVCYFVRDVLTPSFSERVDGKVNDLSVLQDDLLLINGRLLVSDTAPQLQGDEEVATSGDDVVYARVKKETAEKCRADDFDTFLKNVRSAVSNTTSSATLIAYPWELIQQNSDAIKADFAALGKSGIEGTFSEHAAVWGDKNQVYVAKTAEVQPFVCLDTTHGPVIIDEGVVINPQTRIEGPACIGKDSMIVGGKIREGTSIGPVCRVGGEVEESIIHGYSNKYHDGFLGHAYVCEWVNLGALCTNSDLKNDYTGVQVHIRGELMDSKDTKVGSFIGDHTKTSIGTLLNTGTVIGVMSNVVGGSGIAPKFIPSFVTFLNNRVYKVGMKKSIETARTATGRRKKELTDADAELLQHVFKITKPERDVQLAKSRRQIAAAIGIGA